MMMLVVPVAVALVCFIIYAIDRRSKGEPISWESALKLSGFGGMLASGVVFATGPEVVQEAVNVAAEASPALAAAQEMFVGVPTF
jgi:hypothetical protein